LRKASVIAGLDAHKCKSEMNKLCGMSFPMVFIAFAY
jgi:hypothetical protein